MTISVFCNFCLRSLFAVAVAAQLSAPATASETGDTAATGDDLRVSTTRQIAPGGRDGTASAARRDEYQALDTTGERKQPSLRGSGKPGESSVQSASVSNDFWFYTADVVLFNDDDGDGYFHSIDLLFDADTLYDAADVYVVAYLSYEGGPWNEYAVTDVFTLFGATSDDEYVIVTDLTSGYRTGEYDILIELYDAIDGAFLAEFGPADTSELSFLPLEDYERDDPSAPEVIVVGSRGGGGAAALPLLAGLLLAAVVRIGRTAGLGLRVQAGPGAALPRFATRITLRPHPASVSKYAYRAGTTSSETTVEKARPPMMARAIG